MTVLGVLALVMLTPVVPEDISALSDSAYAETRATVNVAPVVSVAVQTDMQTDIIPKSSGSFAMSLAQFKVMTNSNSGYSVYIKSADATSNELVSTDQSNDATIVATGTKTTLEEFAANTWGYAVDTQPIDDNTVFAAVPTGDGEVIATTDESTVDVGRGNTYNLAFGVSVDATLPAGQYSGGVVISAIANPITITSLYQLTYMQEMTADICQNTATEVTKQLIDTRDGNAYWVAKLADGNCWMTQNLALNIPATGLKAADTDIATDWNSSSAYPPMATFVNERGATVVDSPQSTYSWTFNKVVAALPDARTLCKTPGQDRNVITKIEGTLGQTCGQVGFVDVASDWRADFDAQQGAYTYPDGSSYTGLVAVDENYKVYDAHYLVGNFYNINAATAGAGVTSAQQTDTSICPKNWQLPVGRNGGNMDMSKVDKSYLKLLAAYGLATTNGVTFAFNGSMDVVSKPFYFLRTGFIDTGWGILVDLGLQGSMWLANMYNGESAITFNYLQILNTTVQESTTTGRYYGMNVRCVAR